MDTNFKERFMTIKNNFNLEKWQLFCHDFIYYCHRRKVFGIEPNILDLINPSQEEKNWYIINYFLNI